MNVGSLWSEEAVLSQFEYSSPIGKLKKLPKTDDRGARASTRKLNDKGSATETKTAVSPVMPLPAAVVKLLDKLWKRCDVDSKASEAGEQSVPSQG